ncbi:MAG: lipopolysaccharide heptosyltransferase II [Gammaproteobacteria bacterium]|nr:lipopolysaccharide heptosyltransferase II [Gammaproteobacteria bacterium]
MQSADRYLIVGPSWIGDMVMAQSLFIALKNQKPDCTIDVLAPEWSLPILNRMDQINETIPLPVAHGEFAFGLRRQIGKALRKNGYDHAIVIPRSLKAALVPWFAKARIRTGYRGEMRFGLLNDIRRLDKKVLTQTVQRYVALGLERNRPLPPETPYPKLRVDAENQQRVLQRMSLNLDKPVIGFMPGAEYGPAKQWPTSYYGKLAQQLSAAGYQIWIFGSKKDQEVTDKIKNIGGAAVTNLAGRTELVDVVDLLALCKLTVCNDSGLMHVAAAVDRPLVAIYGSSTPDYTPPLTDRADVCYLNLECSPCFKRNCPLGHLNCLKDISVENVFEAINRIEN